QLVHRWRGTRASQRRHDGALRASRAGSGPYRRHPNVRTHRGNVGSPEGPGECRSSSGYEWRVRTPSIAAGADGADDAPSPATAYFARWKLQQFSGFNLKDICQLSNDLQANIAHAFLKSA